MDHDRFRRRYVAACCALLAALATRGAVAQQGDSDDADASVAQACLSHPGIRRTKVLDARNIVFVMRDDRIYNNQLPRQCPGLRRNSIVNYAVANSRLCSGEMFQVLMELGPSNYIPAAVCPLGQFIPITEAELEDLTAMTEPDRRRRASRRSAREAVTSEQVELPAAQRDAATPEAEAAGGAEPAPRD
jgi:hypothetical protein